MQNMALENINIYHIVHIDKLPHILKSGGLLCDKIMHEYSSLGTIIGMPKIKERRMNEIKLKSHPDLYVGDCVPFYFCPRSIMLYIIFRKNNMEMQYTGGQEPIVHLVFNMINVIKWAKEVEHKWAFTTSNAGSYYFDDYATTDDIDKLDWEAISATEWGNCKEPKQAEFLIEKSVDWPFVNEIAVYSDNYADKVRNIIHDCEHKPRVTVMPDWYY